MSNPLFSWRYVLAAMSVAALAGVGPAHATGAVSTADHSKFKELEGPFEAGPEVTRACLQCHTEAARQIHKTKHWTWSVVNERTGQKLGRNTRSNASMIGRL